VSAPLPPPPPTTIIIQREPVNGVGSAGFTISLLGLFTCGLLSPLGLFVSLLGVWRRPRDMAISGAVMGTIGSLWLWLAGMALLWSFAHMITGADERIRTLETDRAEMLRELEEDTEVITELTSENRSDADHTAPTSQPDPQTQPIIEIEAKPTPPNAAARIETVDPPPPPRRPIAVMKGDGALWPSLKAENPVDRQPREVRTWTDATGKFSVRARLVSVMSGRAKLTREDGSEIAVEIAKLSEADQRYIRQQMRE